MLDKDVFFGDAGPVSNRCTVERNGLLESEMPRMCSSRAPSAGPYVHEATASIKLGAFQNPEGGYPPGVTALDLKELP